QPVLSYGVFISFFIATIFMLFVQWYGIRFFLLVNRIPQHHLIPGILLLCVVGSFAINNRLFDVMVLLLFGLIGYWMVMNKFPLAPFILGIILSPMLETNLRQAIATDPNLWLFLSRPISGVLIGLSAISLAYGIYNSYKSRKSNVQEPVSASEQS
ncbi:tripartite tricarboxylate transporter permease, partial [Arthrobacter pigmenti]